MIDLFVIAWELRRLWLPILIAVPVIDGFLAHIIGR